VSSSDPWVDKLTIETPEQTSLDYPLAGIGSRFLAVALDTLIQWGAGLVLFTLFVMVIPAVQIWQGTFNWALAVLILCVFLLMFGYFAIFEAVWNGQTPGKRITRLRVIQDSGRPITVYQAIARNLLRIVDYLPGLYVAGIISVLVSKQNKRLGDFVAGTVVVHEKPFEQSQMSWETPAAEPAVGPQYNVARLTEQELQLIESFLQRRTYLPGEVRATLAAQIANRLAEKLALSPAERPAPEPFLEELARERRGMAGYH
jgi:uncharacterized RDD family membrane protein YckC